MSDRFKVTKSDANLQRLAIEKDPDGVTEKFLNAGESFFCI